MRKKLIIGIASISTVAFIGVGAAAFNQTTNEQPKAATGGIKRVEEKVEITPQPVVTPEATPEATTAPTQNSATPSPAPTPAPAPATPQFGSTTEMMTHLGIPTEEHPMVAKMTQPINWSKSSVVLTEADRKNYFTVLTRFNDHVKSTYGTWTAAHDVYRTGQRW